LGSREPRIGVGDVLNGLKYSRSYSEVLQTVGRLPVYGVVKLWPKTEPENYSATSWTFLFYSKIKLSCKNVGLKFGGMLQKSEMHLFCKFGVFGGY